MKEQLLQFIWRFQYFNQLPLHTEGGELLQIISPGDLNTHQGPDFLNASIRIGNTFWAGHIELHVRSSDWIKHAHESDPHYRNVILHVVWENDLPSRGEGGAGDDMGAATDGGRGKEIGDPPNSGSDGETASAGAGRDIPLLVLQHRIPKLLLARYREWMNHSSFVPCERQLSRVGEKTWSDWKKQLVLERLFRRTNFITDSLKENNQHWEETTWRLLARNMGFPVNTASFEAVAQGLPLSVLGRHRNRVDQLEALLLGQAGLLEGTFTEDYPLALQKEFHYLRQKYHLPDLHPPILYLRMRPGNFPTIRLVQLAGILSQSTAWWARIKEADSPAELKLLLDVRASSYWDNHYSLNGGEGARQGDEDGNGGEEAGHSGGDHTGEEGMGLRGDGDTGDGRGRPKRLGVQMQESILVNTFIPLLFAYGHLRKEDVFQEKALRWLMEVTAEKNALVTGWGRQGISAKNAADTQALLELKGRYCDPRRCLECRIGNFLLRETGSQ